MAQNNFCAEIAEKYANFRKIEKAWRDNFILAKKDKEALRKAYSGMAEVTEARKRIPKCSYERAQEIMGEDFFGAEDFKTTFGFDVPVEIPPIRFSPADLKEAQEHGEMLVLRVGHDNEGNPMTMKRILEIMASRMPEGEMLLVGQKTAGSPLLQDDCWLKDKKLFTTDSLKTEWVLIGKEFAPYTENHNYFQQTWDLYLNMKERNLLTLAEEKENADLKNKLKQLSEKIGVNWETGPDDSKKAHENMQEVAQELGNLPINQKHRRSMVGIFYDLVVRYKGREGERSPLRYIYDWSNTVHSGGILNIGYFTEDGADVRNYRPEWGGGRGVVFVRNSPE